MATAAADLSSESLVLDRYRPLQPLGSGASGSVWLARDVKSGLDVALKIVARDGKAGPRAEREAAAAARLRHERCQRAYAMATDERHVYIAYEYVAGRTLREALRAGTLDDAASIEAAAQLLEGLAHAHSRGIVHRDVKPANVLLADTPEVSVRLLDFGLAQFAEAETLTAVGDVPGTLAYISPERLGGAPATAASDVWSVGVLLWEALAGRHPFWAASLLETAKRIRTGAQPLAAARPDLPRRLVATIDRMLSQSPARRPSASALAQTLRLAAPATATATAGEAPSQRVRRVERRPQIVLPTVRVDSARLVSRLPAPALAGVAAGWTAQALPFYPTAWWPLIAVAAALATLARPRAGLAVALAVPILPLGNIALGLALLYAAGATAWFALFARHARAAFAFALGPLLAPVAALGLLPLLLLRIEHAVRRALAAGAAVLTASVVAGVSGGTLPFASAGSVELELGSTGQPLLAARSLWDTLAAHPGLLLEAIVIAAAAGLLPAARRRGPWGLAVFGALFLGAALLPVGSVAAWPFVAGVWVTCVALAAWDRRVPA